MDNELAIIAVSNSDLKLLRSLSDYDNKCELTRIALRNNDLDTIKYLISECRVSSYDIMQIIENLNSSALYVPLDRNIVKYLIFINKITPDKVALYAIEKNEKELFLEMLDIGAKHLDWLACRCAYLRNREFLELLIDRGLTEFNWIVEFAASSGDLETVKRLVELGANDMNNIAIIAAFNKKLDVLRYAMSNGANNHNKIAYIASLLGAEEIVKEMKSYGSEDFQHLNLNLLLRSR